jgi:hypothetical protein
VGGQCLVVVCLLLSESRSSVWVGVLTAAQVLGTWDFNDEAQVARNTADIAKCTHFDPRCVASSVAVTAAIARMLRETLAVRNSPVVNEREKWQGGVYSCV